MPDLPSYGSLTKNSYSPLTKKGADNVVLADGDVNEDAPPATKSSIIDEHDSSAFQAGNTYYLKNSAPLSIKKALLSAVPILGAVLLMGVIVLFLLRDFNHLYPGRGGDQNPSPEDYHDRSSPVMVPVVVHSLSTTDGEPSPRPRHHSSSSLPVPSSSIKTSHDIKLSSSSAACAAHPNCAGLIGQCCPTDENVKLECCS
jgi:hypothetical protein